MAAGEHRGAPSVAIVGAGVMGRWHVHAARRLGARVAGIVDSDDAAARTLAARAGSAATATFETLGECLAARRVEVVHVCTPLATHADVIETALVAGCHVLAEKPLAADGQETQRLVERARTAGVLLNPVHQFPFQRGFRQLLARRGELGELVGISFRTCSAGGAGRSDAERHAIPFEILPHVASMFSRLLPDGFDPSSVEVVHATGEDLALAGTAAGTALDVFITMRGRPPANELRVVGTRASVLVDLFHGYAVFDRAGVSPQAKIGRPFRLGGRTLIGAGANLALRARRVEPSYPGLRELIRSFYAALPDGPAPIGTAEIMAAAELMSAARR